MSRRKFISQIIQPASVQEAPPPPPGGGLTPYAGSWTTDQVIHLLKRTQFGARPDDVKYFATRTFLQSISELLNPSSPSPNPPVKDYVPASSIAKPDTNIAAGTTWVNDITGDSGLNGNRVSSFQKWWIGNLINQDRSIREKMILFWHNHFATEADTIGNPIYIYRHHQVLRTNALGNFRG